MKRKKKKNELPDDFWSFNSLIVSMSSLIYSLTVCLMKAILKDKMPKPVLITLATIGVVIGIGAFIFSIYVIRLLSNREKQRNDGDND